MCSRATLGRSVFRPRLAAALTIIGLAACSDPTAPGPVQEPSFELVFDGEDGGGRPRLHRATSAWVPVLIGRGIEGRRPAPSPDGQRIAYQTLGSSLEPPRLMLMDAAATSPRPIGPADGLAGEVSWAPDGLRVAFLSQREDPAGDIFVADIVGGDLSNVRNLTPSDPAVWTPQPDRTPSWSPDGARIAFTAYRGGGATIWVMEADGTGARTVTTAGAHGDFEPSWSPDGRWIAFQRVEQGTVRIGIVDAAGGPPRFIDWPTKAYNPAWSPDGGLIAFSSDRDGDMDIFIVTPGGVEVGRVRRPGIDRDPAWIRN